MTAYTRRPRDPDRLELSEFDQADNVVWDRFTTRDPSGLGICCSGGGIRSASYNLGALQELRTSGHLAQADYLAAVSGGTYIAAAHAAIASLSDPAVFEEGPPPWAPGSPEERHLRNHSRYLTEGPGGRFWGVSSMVWGLFAHLLPLVLAAFLAGRVLGSVLDAVSPRVDRSADPGVGLGAPWALLGACGAALAVSFVALWWRRRAETSMADASIAKLTALAAVASRAMQAAVAVAVVGLAVPELFAMVRHLRVAGQVWGFEVKWAQDSQLFWSFLLAQSSVVIGVAGAAWRMRRAIGRFAPLIVSALGPLLLVGPLLYFAYQSAYDGFLGPHAAAMALTLAGSLTAMVLYAFMGHAVRWSPHLFYKERLSSVFMPERASSGAGAAQEVRFPYERTIKMSELATPTSPRGKVPELVVCAALNVSDSVVPPGRGADTFTFTSTEVGCPATGYIPTTEFEDRAGHTPLSLPAMVAISGAALSPSMGHMTRPWGRFALAVLNVRLGVWVPNPRRLDDMPVEVEGAWSWAKVKNRLARGWYEPGPLYVLFEALGMNTLKRRFVYVTDGGHWENLGLVELLRRRCTRVVCFDAAGDSLSSFNTLAEAIALARSELQVAIDIAPADGLLPGDDGFSASDHVVGDITYPDGLKGTLVFVKAAMPADAPWDVKAYHATHPLFPCEGTMDQFFDDAQFRAYQALGAHAGRGVVRTLAALDAGAAEGAQPVVFVDEVAAEAAALAIKLAFIS